MNFNKQHRSYLVGAQFIGALPIYRPGEGNSGSWADKSAMGAINRPLQNDRSRLLMFIIEGRAKRGDLDG